MKKAIRNYVVNFIMFLLALFEAVSGFVLWRVLPRGGGYWGGRGLTPGTSLLWSRDAWVDLHNWVAVTSSYGANTFSSALEVDSPYDQRCFQGEMR